MSKDTSKKHGLPLICAGISCIVISIILFAMAMKLKSIKLKHKKQIGATAIIIGVMGVLYLLGGLLIHFGEYKVRRSSSAVSHPHYSPHYRGSLR